MRRLSRSAELARPRLRHRSSGSRARVGLQDAHRSASSVFRVRTLLRHDFRIRCGFHGKLLRGRFSAASTRCGLTATATPRPSGLSPRGRHPPSSLLPPASFSSRPSPPGPFLPPRLAVCPCSSGHTSFPPCLCPLGSSCAHALLPRAFPCGPCTSCACPSRGRGPALGAGRAVSSRHTRPCFPPSPHLKRPECVGRLRAVASGVAAPFALLAWPGACALPCCARVRPDVPGLSSAPSVSPAVHTRSSSSGTAPFHGVCLGTWGGGAGPGLESCFQKTGPWSKGDTSDPWDGRMDPWGDGCCPFHIGVSGQDLPESQ